MISCQTVSKAKYAAEQALAAKLNEEGVAPDDLDTIGAEHPEGRKRGGVVEAFEDDDGAIVFWDHVDESWVGYNDEGDDE